MWETEVQLLGWEDPLEKGKATHSSILAWTIPWTRGHKQLDMTGRLSLHFTSCYNITRLEKPHKNERTNFKVYSSLKHGWFCLCKK